MPRHGGASLTAVVACCSAIDAAQRPMRDADVRRLVRRMRRAWREDRRGAPDTLRGNLDLMVEGPRCTVDALTDDAEVPEQRVAADGTASHALVHRSRVIDALFAGDRITLLWDTIPALGMVGLGGQIFAVSAAAPPRCGLVPCSQEALDMVASASHCAAVPCTILYNADR